MKYPIGMNFSSETRTMAEWKIDERACPFLLNAVSMKWKIRPKPGNSAACFHPVGSDGTLGVQARTCQRDGRQRTAKGNAASILFSRSYLVLEFQYYWYWSSLMTATGMTV